MSDRIHAGARPICLLLILAGCKSYEQKPLEPEEILNGIAQRRTDVAVTGAESLTLGEATALMRKFNPRVRDARAAYETEYAFAAVKTPLPNPTIKVAPTVLSGPGVLAGKKRGVEGALGWAIVLGGKRRLTDDVNAIRAEAAQVDFGGVEREEYLALRREYVDLAMTGRLVAARDALQQTTDRSLAIMRRLVDAAQATALDVREFELETFLAEADGLGAVQREADAQSRLGGRTGVTAEAFRAAELPDSPADVPALETLRQLALSDHPDLARRRAQYNVAEKELRLEYARQYPYLNIGATYERVEGVEQYGLGVGIEIPLFDRNQPGIARAKAHREQIRAAFESEVERRLAAIEAARRRLVATRNTFEVMELKIAPAADLTLKLARAALEAGAADALRFLTVVRQQRLLRIEILEAQGAMYLAWSDLEQACGAPLLHFEGEPKAPGSSTGAPLDPKSQKENS